MDELLRSLGGLALKAIPTFLLVVALHFYLKRMFFRPMARVLEERYRATEGAKKAAAESLARTAEKAAEYEASLRAARGELYREQDEARQRLRQQHADAAKQAHADAQAAVKEAGHRLAEELAAAKQSLAARTGDLADEIVDTVLHGRAV
jgi:F0F1-type ATP synthase membrane subunit b/b'